MLKRVAAWVLLFGFVLLLLNILVFHQFLEASISIYLIVAVGFLFTNKSVSSGKANKRSDEAAEDNAEKL